METDTKGNIIVLGTYDQIFDIDGNTLVIEGGQEFFLARVDVITLTTDVVEIPQDYSLDFLVDQANKSLMVTLPEDLLSAKGGL